MNNFKVLMNGIVKENPTFVLLLGMCPTLGTTSSAINGMGMGLATAFVLICSNVVISVSESHPGHGSYSCFCGCDCFFCYVIANGYASFCSGFICHFRFVYPIDCCELYIAWPC